MSSSPVKLTHQETPVQTHHPKPKTQPNSSHSKSGRAASPRLPATAHASSSQAVESSGRKITVPKRKLDRSTSNLQNAESSKQPVKQPKISPPENKKSKIKTRKTSTNEIKVPSAAQNYRESIGTQGDYSDVESILLRNFRGNHGRNPPWLLTIPKNEDNENREEKEYEDRRCILSAIKIAIDVLKDPLRNHNLSKDQCAKLFEKPEVPEDFYKDALRMISKCALLLRKKVNRGWINRNGVEKVNKAKGILENKIGNS